MTDLEPRPAEVGPLEPVRASAACPHGRILAIDEPALEASMNQTMQWWTSGRMAG